MKSIQLNVSSQNVYLFRIIYLAQKGRRSFYQIPASAIITVMLILSCSILKAQTVSGSWDAASSTASSGYTNWGNGVITLTDTTTGSGSCQGSAVHETSTTYNPTLGASFSQCYRVFFGCPGNDQIGTLGSPYTDLNGDGMAFSFWNHSATYNSNAVNACGGGLGYHSAVSDNKMITIEFDTYSSLGTSGVDGCYGGGAPGSGINDEISIHKDGDSGDSGLLTGCPNAGGTVNAGNLEDGKAHDVCITYTPGTHILKVTLDGVTMINYDLGATYNLETYFGNSPLNQTWSAGKYGANNFQTVGPSGSNLQGQIGHSFCGTLPVSFLTFNGEEDNGNVLFNWSTATETNNSKFIIERTTDLSSWNEIGEVKGANNSSSITNYKFIDFAPATGIVYYRLRQIDNDGQFSYSKVISINTNQELVTIAPNPFEDEFIVYSHSSSSIDIQIQDVLGQVLYFQNRVGERGEIVIHPDLPPGTYFLTLQSDNWIEQKKIIKK
jgi:hypothetical protein